MNARRLLTAAAFFGALFSTASHALEADAVFDKVSPSVWGVLTVDAQGRPLTRGSAVVIGAGRLVTNCYVLAKASSFVVRRENVSYGATLEYPDIERDLCQIKVSNFTAPAVEMGDLSRLRVGAKVYAIGNPRGLEVTLSDGLVSGVRRSEAGAVEMVQTSAPISAGSSGGGLFDADGKLVGITSFALRDAQNLNFALPVSFIAELETRGKAALAQRAAGAPVASAQPARPVGPGATPVAPQEAPQTAGELAAGNNFAYKVTDRLSGSSQRVNYRLDRFDGTRAIYNGGARVEGPDGEVIEGSGAPGGEMDLLTPPGGWMKDGVMRPGTWSAQFRSRTVTSTYYDYRLTVTTGAEGPITTTAGEFQAVRIDLRGWLTKRSRESANDFYTGAYEATLWYVPSLRRIVKLQAQHKLNGRNSPMKEESELVRFDAN